MNRILSLLLLLTAVGAVLLSAACGGDGVTRTNRTAKISADPITADGRAPDTVAEQILKDAGTDPRVTASVVARGMAGPGYCEVTVSGDQSVTFRSGGGVAAVATDYWYSDAELREMFTQMARVFADRSEAEIERRVREQMQNEPRMMLLVLNCGDAGDQAGSLSLLPGEGSTYANVPFAPKTYPLAKGGVLGGGAKAGEFGVLLSVKDGIYGLDEPGELKITKFDETGIAGSFTFKASEWFTTGTAKKVMVRGTFDFGCTGGAKCKR